MGILDRGKNAVENLPQTAEIIRIPNIMGLKDESVKRREVIKIINLDLL